MSGAERAARQPAPGGDVVWPFFDAGPASPADALPLGLVAGGLIFDSGEAERTFLFRCQDRYLGFNTLHGLRTVLFVANDEHARIYQSELARFGQTWRAVAEVTGVLPPEGPPEPLFVSCDIDRLKLGSCWALLDQLRRGVLARGAAPRLLLNQLSPTYAAFVAQLDALLRAHGAGGGYAVEECARLGGLALHFHDKAHYVELLRQHAGEELPPHVPTAVLPPERFMAARSWRELVALYREATGDGEPAALFVKSSRDSSGNVAARLTAETFESRAAALRHEVEQHILCRDLDFAARVRELRGEVDAAPTLRPLALTDDRLLRYKRQQAERRAGIRLLVQREVTPPPDLRGRFAGIGLSFHVWGPNEVEPLCVAAQIYRDPDRRSYLGSYLSPALVQAALRPEPAARLRHLCRLFAEQGWRGPINFDARLNEAGEYELIYDCNPRLTAVYPPLAVRAGLRRQGLEAETLLSLGYRGDFVWEDLPARLAALSARGFLFTPKNPRGAVVLPNLSRRNGYDVVLVNVDVPAARQMLASGAFNESGATGPPRIYE